MLDREKVIKALKCRKDADKRCGNPCEYTGLCHYAKAIRGSDGEIYFPYLCDRERICADAIAMLKEQETEKAALKVLADRQCEVNHHQYERKGFCPECHQEIKLSMNRNYCGFCGQLVKWND